MKTVLQGLGCVALLAVVWLAAEGAYSIRYARQRSVYTFDQLNKVLRETSQTLDETRKAATTWNTASEKQSQYATLALGSIKETTASIQTLVKRTDASLNESVFPSLVASVKEQNQSLSKTQTALQENLLALSKATAAGQKTIEDADAVISSPKLQETLASTAESANNLASATADGAATMKDVRIAVDKEVQTLLAPVNKAKMIVLFTAQLIGRLYGF